MSMPAAIDLSGAAGLGVLAIRGADAARFLQGQLSTDTEKLAPGASTLAGLHNAQGRVVALLALVRPAPEEFLAALPWELIAPVAQRLGKYVFRAKVRIGDESDAMRVLGAAAGTDPAAGVGIAWGGRRLLLVPRGTERIDPDSSLAAWERADVEAGLPQVFSATSESFVAQMLNLDLLGAIAFDKGCYTGQEVIARAHYRGRVKRRMQLWRSADGGGVELRPGDVARSRDGRALTVVRTARDEQGRQEVLAVGNFGAAPDTATESADAGGAVLDGPLPLPYSLPE
jgi:folate-binding protein YgfZ